MKGLGSSVFPVVLIRADVTTLEDGDEPTGLTVVVVSLSRWLDRRASVRSKSGSIEFNSLSLASRRKKKPEIGDKVEGQPLISLAKEGKVLNRNC